ncbi:glucokinase [Dyella psychrodurans]|uniref:ROK family protein n=1 Tax=Dyella psychrodurans TaxID=1927960 RepID=A0A370XCT1_9GAMM|nr:glucokinase [Dyella psychrodurans]RDS86199.1 ROK family protein [Dyella psychrodurans]
MMEMSGVALTPSPEPLHGKAVLLGHGESVGVGEGAFLSADIGGTHARLALVAPTHAGDTPRILAARTYRCADHPHLEDIVRCFCQKLDVQPRELVLACAGYLHAGSVISKNLAWPVRLDAMKQALALEQVRFVNDLEALAYAVGQKAVEGTVALKHRAVGDVGAGPMVVIGPGTGLGAAVWLPGEPPRVMATEAGHTQLAARAGIEQQVLARVSQPNSHADYEAVLSGPGLHRLYMALCAIHDRYPLHDEPAAVTAAAIEGKDEIAHRALSLFCGWLGSFAADLAMLYGATGGVYLAGGFLSQMIDFMRQSPLIERFLDKGVMRPFLQRLPIHVMGHGQYGVIGAARWHLDSRREHVRIGQTSVTHAWASAMPPA